MAVIWGLDLKEMQWGKFKNSYMWANIYHLRRTKFIVYQLAMILCVISESLGTDSLSNYVDEQSDLEKQARAEGVQASIYNNDIVGAFSYNIFAGIFVATIFGAAFFFDLFWPERREIKSVRIAWRVTSILAIVFALSSALTMTIILATHQAHTDGDANRFILDGPPLSYKHNGEAIASVVLIWLGTVATAASAALMWKSIAHNNINGPVAAHLRNSKEAADHPFLCHGDPGSASNGAGAAGSSAFEKSARHSTRGAGATNGHGYTNGGDAEMQEKHRDVPADGALPSAPSAYQAADAPVPEPYTVNPQHDAGLQAGSGHYTSGPHTVVNGPTTTTTTTTSSVMR